MITVTAPCEAPSHPAGFRHLWDLAASWNGTWRYRPAAAALEDALRQAGSELGDAFGRLEAAAEDARRQVADALRQVEAARRDGPDVLVACVYGDSVTEIRGAALIEGAALWGEKADLAVEGVGGVMTSAPGSRRGRFNGRVRVRCLNYAEIEQPGHPRRSS